MLNVGQIWPYLENIRKRQIQTSEEGNLNKILIINHKLWEMT